MAAHLEDFIEGSHHRAFHPLVGAPEQRHLNRELAHLARERATSDMRVV